MPLVSKVCNIRMVPLAIEIITAELTGQPSPVPQLKEHEIPYYGVKEAVFPFNMFQEVDPVLEVGNALNRRSAGTFRFLWGGVL